MWESWIKGGQVSFSMASVLALVLASALVSGGMALGHREATSAPHSPNPPNPTMQAVGRGQSRG